MKPKAAPNDSTTDHPAASFKIKVTPVGISQAQMDAVEKALPRSKSLAPLRIHDSHSFFDATSADLDQFLTGESLKGEDILVWYHPSFLHTQEADIGDRQPTPAEGAKTDTIGGGKSRRADLVPVGY
ncbi:MAG TPA: hypothetical protein VGI60_12605 [Chthoniobacterales bacterium]